jgi:hypothetical protein
LQAYPVCLYPLLLVRKVACLADKDQRKRGNISNMWQMCALLVAVNSACDMQQRGCCTPSPSRTRPRTGLVVRAHLNKKAVLRGVRSAKQNIVPGTIGKVCLEIRRL